MPPKVGGGQRKRLSGKKTVSNPEEPEELGKPPEQPKPPRGKIEKSAEQVLFDARWAKAVQFKNSFLATTAHATQLKQSIENSEQFPQWKWAKNAANLGELNRVGMAVQSALTAFRQRWLTENTAQLKKTLSKAVLAVEIEKMGDEELHKKLTQLKDCCDTLVRRHGA